MKWFRISHPYSKRRVDKGLHSNALNWFQNCFWAFGAQLTSESCTAECWENPLHPSEKNLPPGLDSLPLDSWPKPTLCVQDDPERMCVFGPLFSAHENHSRGKDNAPTAGEDEIICKWLVKAHTSFSWSAVARLHPGADAIHHVIIYLGAFWKCCYLLNRLYIDYLKQIFDPVDCTSPIYCLNEHVGTLKYADQWHNRRWALETGSSRAHPSHWGMIHSWEAILRQTHTHSRLSGKNIHLAGCTLALEGNVWSLEIGCSY